MQVFVNSEADVDKLSAKYDLAEYKQVEDDGTIQLNIDVDADERAELRKPWASASGRRSRTPRRAPRSTPSARRPRPWSRSRVDLAKNGVPRGGIKLEGKSVVPTPGETVIQRANKFTNYAGTFLYVEAHNKATVRTAPGANAVHRPDAGGRRSRAPTASTRRPPTNMPRFIDTDPTPDEYLYHRQLIRLTPEQAAIPASQMTVRVAATSGAVDTFKVTEWLGTTLPPNVAGYQKGFFNRYQDPTENRAQLDALAAEFANLMTRGQPPEPDERLPAQVAGDHVRLERHRLGAGRPARHADPRPDGRDHRRGAGRLIHVQPAAERAICAITTDGIPSGSTDLILTLKDPSGTVLHRSTRGPARR